jgi:hypothetical protein
MATAIINGKKIPIPANGISGSKISDIATSGNHKRRAVISNGKDFKTIKRNKTYHAKDLVGKKGKVTSIPERTKGYGKFGGPRNERSKQIILEQVADVAGKLFKGQNIQLDKNNMHWMVVPKYKLPKNWHHIAETTPLRISFPNNYPEEPPIGFYLKEHLILNSANGHLYNQAYHQADQYPIQNGWQWYCVYLNNGAWQPAYIKYPGDWKKGDNLWTYFQLISEVLGSAEHD